MYRQENPHPTHKKKILERFGKKLDRKTSPSRREREYQGPAHLVSEAGNLPINVLSFLGKLDEPSGARYKFAAELNTPNIRRRIQGGVWAERVNIPKTRFFRKEEKRGISSDLSPADLPTIADGYKGPAMLVDGDCAIPIYIGGIGEETGKGFVRARLDLPEGQIRLEGEIDHIFVRERPPEVENLKDEEQQLGKI